MFILVKNSSLTGKENSMEISLTPAEYREWARLEAERTRPLVQDAFPQLSDDEREFIITGITPEEWNEFMGSDDDESMDDWTEELDA
jgi:hypothetical protein